jgi:hypothetical protein
MLLARDLEAHSVVDEFGLRGNSGPDRDRPPQCRRSADSSRPSDVGGCFVVTKIGARRGRPIRQIAPRSESLNMRFVQSGVVTVRAASNIGFPRELGE